jgi:hypothetical protein
MMQVELLVLCRQGHHQQRLHLWLSLQQLRLSHWNLVAVLMVASTLPCVVGPRGESTLHQEAKNA